MEKTYIIKIGVGTVEISFLFFRINVIIAALISVGSEARAKALDVIITKTDFLMMVLIGTDIIAMDLIVMELIAKDMIVRVLM